MVLDHDERVFHNKPLQSRHGRYASRDKESREKLLLEQRPSKNGVKFINYGRHLTAAPKGTMSYISEQDRFFTDFSAEEKKRREMQYAQKQQFIDQKRYELAVQEEQRWKDMDRRWARDDERQEAKMSRGCPKNVSSVPYNPLTLEYKPSKEGDMLRFSDNQILYRAAVRAENLRKMQNTSGYNPITGEQNATSELPPKPTKPQ